MKKIIGLALVLAAAASYAQQTSFNKSKFHPMDELLPTPNVYRAGSGAPGSEYWQQKADYEINIKLNDKDQSVQGNETISYTNNSPDALTYLWLQLDQNLFSKTSDTYATETKDKLENMSFEAWESFKRQDFDGGYKILSVKDTKGNAIKYTINKTMMRIELPSPLKTKNTYTFSIEWNNNINNCKTHGGRGGYEYFEKDGNYIYEMAQWYPRMCVYDDYQGWETKQYLGGGEFALEFGDFKVNITVPADHIVAATGELQNPNQVLSKTQIERWNKAKVSEKPLIVINQNEAEKNESSKSTETKTWTFEAKNVRDFAWASSRKFIWDCMKVRVGDKDILAMSYYPKEGNPLWERYSTHAIAQTLTVYSRHSVNYAYPVAISINGPVGGMEYPMICFNGPRPEADGTYSERTKYGLISVVIHEVGHNFFPMIINSDERKYAWMDEGFNTFCQYLTEKEFEREYPTLRGEARSIINYMSQDASNLEPIMSSPDNINQLGPVAYGKVGAALNVLRETVMGRDLFDYAFKEYGRRWAYKHPKPADFFRTMEDASGMDLDWFWRGWFFGTEPCDISINNVSWYTNDTQNPEVEKANLKAKKQKENASISKQRDLEFIKKTRVDLYPELADFYNNYDALSITNYDKEKYKKYLETLDSKQAAALQSGLNYYLVEFENVGGLVMPLIVELQYTDGTKEIQRIPAEIWRKNSKKVNKLFITQKPVQQINLDPYMETADINMKNNGFPRAMQENKFQLMKSTPKTEPNKMQLEKEGKL